MLKEPLPEVYILILIVFYSAFIAFGGQVLRVMLLEMEALGAAHCCPQKRASMERFVVAMGGNGWQRFKKDPMKSFLVGKTFPIAPITAQQPRSPTTNFSRHRYRRHRRRLALGIPARGGKSIHRDHGAPIDSGVAAEQESRPATNATTTTTTANAAAVIAALAVKAAVAVDAPATMSPHTISTPGYSPITSTTTPPLPSSPPSLHPRGIRAKKEGYVPETPSVTGEAVGGRQGPLPVKEGDDRGSKAGERAVGAMAAEGGPGLA